VPFEPPGPDAEDEAPTAHVVDRAGHVRQQIRVPVRVTGDEGADLDAAGLLGPGAEHGPALEVLAVRFTAEREEVVPVEDDVYAGVLGARNRVADLGVIGVLGLDLDSDANGSAHTGERMVARRGPPTGRSHAGLLGPGGPRAGSAAVIASASPLLRRCGVRAPSPRNRRPGSMTPAATNTAAAPTQNGRWTLISSPSLPARNGATAPPE